jgi:predicted ArsR family transcriptional regulator
VKENQMNESLEFNSQSRDEIEYGRAFSNKRRIEILKLLANEPKSVQEISDSLSLRTANVRHHLRTLVRSKLVEEIGEKHHEFGRPTVLYRARQTSAALEFPKRKYEMLSELLITALSDNMSLGNIAKILQDIGYKAGIDVVNQLALKHGIKRWDIDTFKRLIVEEHLVELGEQPEVISSNEKEIIFRTHNCVFQEISHRHPDIICNSLDKGIIQGVMERSLGYAEHERVKCKGHGDPHCEHIIKVKDPDIELNEKKVPINTIS